MSGTIRRIWRNFSVFWKSQIYWPAVGAVIVLVWQYFTGKLSGSIRENVWHLAIPYIGLVALFLAVNVGHAIFRAEWKSLKKLEHDERRANRRVEIERAKPPVHKPNLKFRRVFLGQVFVGHAMSGKRYNAWFVEIGNELSDREIGHAKGIRGHITYSDMKDNTLQTICPAQWGTYQPESEANIRQGEGCALILACDKGYWFSDLIEGIRLPGEARINVRVIDAGGKDILSEPLLFAFRTWGLEESECKKL